MRTAGRSHCWTVNYSRFMGDPKLGLITLGLASRLWTIINISSSWKLTIEKFGSVHFCLTLSVILLTVCKHVNRWVVVPQCDRYWFIFCLFVFLLSAAACVRLLFPPESWEQLFIFPPLLPPLSLSLSPSPPLVSLYHVSSGEINSMENPTNKERERFLFCAWTWRALLSSLDL